MGALDSAELYRRRGVLDQALRYLSSGPVLAMAIRKPIDGVESEYEEQRAMRALIGGVDPNEDRVDQNTQSIRGCFGDDLVHNVLDVHYQRTQREFRAFV